MGATSEKMDPNFTDDIYSEKQRPSRKDLMAND